MAKSKKILRDEASEIHVRLKPLFGIAPGTYLTVLYALLLGGILFFLLVFPGLRKNGSTAVITTNPENVRVLVDGHYAADSPCKIFLPRGERTITLETRHFQPLTLNLHVSGRIFGSLFFPRKLRLHEELTVENPALLLKDSFSDAARWSMIESFHENYQKPPVFLRAADAFVYAGLSRDEATAFFLRGAALVRNEDMLGDYLEGYSRALSGKGIVSPYTLLEIVRNYIHYLEKHPAFLFWLPEALNEDRREQITESSWFQQAGADYAGDLQAVSEELPKFVSRVTLQGNTFIGVRGGTFLLGGDSTTEYPVQVQVSDLYVQDREVSQEMYRRFLEENPAWRKDALDTLLEEALVTEDYLKDLEMAGETYLPVRYVSYHAAKAYCAWLQKALPESFSGWTVRLPYEAEWEWLALRDEGNGGIFLSTGISGPQAVQKRAPNSLGTYDLSGNLWEWCENWFYPAGYTVENGYHKTEESYDFETGAEKAVRGGSWANRREEVTIRSRGSQPAEWCTPFTGFRPVLVRE